MTTERLNEFVVLANVLNFSKAADKLYITQSILSRHIIDMEKELGLKLFIRDTHGVSLTDEGKYFLREIQPLLKQTDNVMALLQENQMTAGGALDIYCSEQVLNTPIMDFMGKFQSQYEDISLAFHLYNSSTPRDLIGSTDIFLSPCDLKELLPEHVESALLTTQQALIAFPSKHPFGSIQSICLEDLRDETLLVPFADEMFGPYAQLALLTERKTHGHIMRLPVESAPDALLLTELHQGVTIIPHHFKHRLYPHTRTIPITDGECFFPIYCYCGRKKENAAAKLFFESITRHFQE